VDAEAFRAALSRLGLSQLEAARLLGVKSRTIQRWVSGSPAVGRPAAEALRAWCCLAEHGLAWRPDSEAIEIEDLAAIGKQRQQALGLKAMIERVAARGGSTKRWRINLRRRRAKAGSIAVTFNILANGGFSPASYRRLDGIPDRARDQLHIEEAIVAFAEAVLAAGSNWAADADCGRSTKRPVTGLDQNVRAP